MENHETSGLRSDCWQHSSVQIPEKHWLKHGFSTAKIFNEILARWILKKTKTETVLMMKRRFRN